jgi:hypothetical protein
MPVWHAGSPAGCEVREPMSFPAGILWGGRNEYKKRTGTNRWGGSRRYCYPHCQALGWLKAVRGRPLVGMPEKVRANRVVDRIMWITFIATNVFGETARAFQFGDDIYGEGSRSPNGTSSCMDKPPKEYEQNHNPIGGLLKRLAVRLKYYFTLLRTVSGIINWATLLRAFFSAAEATLSDVEKGTQSW